MRVPALPRAPRDLERDHLCAERFVALLERLLVELDLLEDRGREVRRDRAEGWVVRDLAETLMCQRVHWRSLTTSATSRKARSVRTRRALAVTHRDQQHVPSARNRARVGRGDLALWKREVDLVADARDEVLGDLGVGEAEPAFVGCCAPRSRTTHQPCCVTGKRRARKAEEGNGTHARWALRDPCACARRRARRPSPPSRGSLGSSGPSGRKCGTCSGLCG